MTASTSTLHASYSTDNIDTSRRFEYWHDIVLRHCIPAASKPQCEHSFHGNLLVRDFGVLDICTLSSSFHFWERTEQHLRTGPDDDIWLAFMEDGYGQLEQGDRRTTLNANNLVLYDAAQAFQFNLEGKSNHLVRIPRYMIDSRLKDVEDLTAVVLDEKRPGAIPLREMLRQAVIDSQMLSSDDISSRYSQTIVDLLVLSLELHDSGTMNKESNLYAQIMKYIHRHLCDHDLNLNSLAEAHHVSTRTITRAFARNQTSPMSVVWHERLKASRAAIERGHVRSISQVALDFGFSDFSHFSHAFRKAFGVSPQYLLKQRKLP